MRCKTTQEERAYNVCLAWLTFFLCLIGFSWLCHFVPPWNRPLPLEPGDGQTPIAELGLWLGLLELAIMLVCCLWVVPSACRWLWDGIVRGIEVRDRREQANDEEIQRWCAGLTAMESGKTLPPKDWLEISEPVKTALLDFTMGSAKREKPWPEALPPLTPAALAQRLQTQVDQTLAQVVEMMNQSPKGEIAPELQPRFKQLFKDLEHDIIELGRQLRIQAAYEQLPPPQGHRAERYRQMKKETAIRSSENPPHGPLPASN